MLSIAEHSAHSDPTVVAMVVMTADRLLIESLPDNQGPLCGIQLLSRSTDFDALELLIQRSAPRLVLFDRGSFPHLLRILSQNVAMRLGQTRTAIFGDELSDTQLEVAVSSGVSGVLSRHDSLDELGKALRALGRGSTHVSAALQSRLTSELRGDRLRVHRRARLSDFSNQQLEILIQIADGKRVRDIAAEMQLSEKSVESHKYRLMNRLGFSDRVELCRWAIREGLISA